MPEFADNDIDGFRGGENCHVDGAPGFFVFVLAAVEKLQAAGGGDAGGEERGEDALMAAVGAEDTFEDRLEEGAEEDGEAAESGETVGFERRTEELDSLQSWNISVRSCHRATFQDYIHLPAVLPSQGQLPSHPSYAVAVVAFADSS